MSEECELKRFGPEEREALAREARQLQADWLHVAVPSSIRSMFVPRDYLERMKHAQDHEAAAWKAYKESL